MFAKRVSPDVLAQARAQLMTWTHERLVDALALAIRGEDSLDERQYRVVFKTKKQCVGALLEYMELPDRVASHPTRPNMLRVLLDRKGVNTLELRA